MATSLALDFAMGCDPALFARRLGLTLDPWQRDALLTPSRRAIWLACRQSGKSTTAALLALHTALYKPSSLTLLVSASFRQSSELYRKVVTFLNQLDERPKLVEENKLSLTTATGSRIVSLPSSESTIRGFSGVDLLVEDEAAFVDDSVHAACRPMLATSNGRLVLLSTPHARRGHFFDLWEKGGPDWYRVKVTADECPRISPEFLAEERRTLGEFWFLSEYQCEFTDTIFSTFRSEDIDRAFHREVDLWF